MYFLLTLELFKRLFRDELKQIGTKWLLRLLEWLSLVLLVLSVVLSYQHFLPIVWAATALGVLVVVTLLVRILQKTQSRVAMWYSVSIAITLISTLYEVIAAALGLRGLIGSINSVTAALSSSLLAALAVAQHMRQEHEQHVQVQAKLKHTYDAMPIGLFTLDLRGRFLSANPAFADMVGKRSMPLREAAGNSILVWVAGPACIKWCMAMVKTKLKLPAWAPQNPTTANATW